MDSLSDIKIGIVAPSSRVPMVEFALGVERIREEGLSVRVHSQCKKGHLFFAGTDEERARAFFDYARDPELSVIWCARGGYGAARLLPLLDQMVASDGIPPRKLLVGYSDATALMEYVRTRWGWSTLHASMPGLRKFCLLTPAEWRATLGMIRTMARGIRGEAEGLETPHETSWLKGRRKTLKFWRKRPDHDISGQLVGGNLTVWTSLIGTPYAGEVGGRIILFEDVDEPLYRIDRMVNQLITSGQLEGAQAVVLGNFLNCRDSVPDVLSVMPSVKARVRAVKSPRPKELAPLRKRLNEARVIPEIFGQIYDRLKIPVAYSLPVGHGPDRMPIALGEQYQLKVSGAFLWATF